MVEDSRVRPEPPLGPNKHLLLLLLEFLIWISKESHGDTVWSLTGSSHVSNWTKLVEVQAGSHLRGTGSCSLGLNPSKQIAAGDQP